MKYIGVPNCPYCKKGVNLIRVWSVKKHGEYMCPRCKGISNIYLSPLTYVFAVLAIAAGFLIYFFQKFVLDSVSLMTAVYVFIPFALFFLLTLFMVYFEKPVIKKVRKTEDGRYFDQNGTELKMKMGKLVAATGKTGLQDIPPSAAARSNNMTGQMERVRSQGQPVQRQAVPPAEQQRRYGAPSPKNVPQRPSLNQMFGAEEDAPRQKKAYNTPEFEDNEALYASAAEKLGRNFTREISKTEVEQGLGEKRKAIEEQPIRTPASARPAGQTERRPQPAAGPAQRAPAPARERPQAAPAQQVKAAAPAQAARPEQRPQPSRLSEHQGKPPVNKIAQERDVQRAAKSGFEDLIAEYDRLANQKTGEIPIRRTAGKKEDEQRKSSGFRQL